MNFIDSFSKNKPISDFIKMRPVGAELFRAGGGTGMTMLIVAIRNFANAPKDHNAPNKRQDYWHTAVSALSL
jgi:hypothetical protein